MPGPGPRAPGERARALRPGLELRQRYPQITRSRPRLTRQQLEDLANRWQLARQWATGESTACDVQSKERRSQQCLGWDEWSDEDLEDFHATLCSEPIEIVPN
ncbi:MAG: hypothetical protein HOP15_03970 [Planctomycetes bacterium]|nr:hypothetical protein [Planctomycetota bacterium]